MTAVTQARLTRTEKIANDASRAPVTGITVLSFSADYKVLVHLEVENMISATAQYALRALTYMAALPEGTTVLSRDLAGVTQVPPNYLSKVLLALCNAGLLHSTRGAGGGYRLNKPADHIYLIDVVELFEGSKAKPTCLLNNRPCSDETPCHAHKVWRGLSMVYTGFLVTTTLAAVAGVANKPPAVAVNV